MKLMICWITIYWLVQVSVNVHTFLTFCKHPPGKYCSFESSYQFDCPKGHYCPKDKYYKSCPTGTFLNETGMSMLSDCLNCTAGSFCSRRGLDLPNGLCKRGFFCPAGSKSLEENICPINHFCWQSSPGPVACNIGEYQPELGSWHCETCPKVQIWMNVTQINYLDTNITIDCFLNVIPYQKENIDYSVYVTIQRILSENVTIIYNSSDTFVILNNTLSNTSHVIVNLSFHRQKKAGTYFTSCVINSSQCGLNVKEKSFVVNDRGTLVVSNQFAWRWYIVIILSCLLCILIVSATIMVVRKKSVMILERDSISRKTSTISASKKEIHVPFSPVIKRDADHVQLISIQLEAVHHVKENFSVSEDLCVIDNCYDVFICYSSVDRVWVKDTLLKELEKHDVKACIDFRDFLVGAYIVENITEAIFNSNKTIAVLSPDFLSSMYCKAELKQALSRLDKHQVIPVLYRPCDVPNELKHMTYLDWCHPDVQPHFCDLLIKAIKSN